MVSKHLAAPQQSQYMKGCLFWASTDNNSNIDNDNNNKIIIIITITITITVTVTDNDNDNETILMMMMIMIMIMIVIMIKKNIFNQDNCVRFRENCYQCRSCQKKKMSSDSHTGSRTRAAWVKTRNPNR